MTVAAPAREIKRAVIIHIDKNGDHTVRVWDPTGEVLVLWVDENCPGDRVYEQLSREDDIADLKALIGSDTIGNSEDGRIDEQTAQAIRAMHWRMTGGKLGEANPAE